MIVIVGGVVACGITRGIVIVRVFVTMLMTVFMTVFVACALWIRTAIGCCDGRATAMVVVMTVGVDRAIRYSAGDFAFMSMIMILMGQALLLRCLQQISMLIQKTQFCGTFTLAAAH